MKTFTHDNLIICPQYLECDGLFNTGDPCRHNTPHELIKSECGASSCKNYFTAECIPTTIKERA